MLLFVTQFVIGIPIDSIESRQINPIAPRGGVLMVQLISENNGDQWPSEIPVYFEDGTMAIGLVGWIEKKKEVTTWTGNYSTIRSIKPTDNTSNIRSNDSAIGPVLLIELPRFGSGKIQFGQSVIAPTWIDLPTTFPSLQIDDLAITDSMYIDMNDRFPEWNPLEYWRWTIIGSRSHQLPPPLSDTGVGRLAALQGEQLWRIGFDRLAKSSRGIAAECRDLLSNTAMDNGHEFACWVVQPESLHRLLSILLDLSSTSRQLSSRALRWIEEQQPFIHWLEQVYGKDIIVAIANPTPEPILTSIQWQEEGDIPIGFRIPSFQTLRAQISRPPIVDNSIFGPVSVESLIRWLSLTIDKKSSAMPIIPPDVTGLPPSIQFQSLHPLWTLQSIRNGKPLVTPQSGSTTVQLRKVFGIWELFVRCNGISDTGKLTKIIHSVSQLRGSEAITILNPSMKSLVVITPQDQQIPNGMNLFRAIDANGWSVRIELPEHWVSQEYLSIAIARTHGESQKVETGPLPCVPWNINPTPIVVHLALWDEISDFSEGNK